jgi:quercetin dioxygenase-like cupin family protein
VNDSRTQLLIDTGSGVGNTLTVRRVVTGHDATGKAVVQIDGPAPKSAFGVTVWSTDRWPADNQLQPDAQQGPAQITTGGSVIRVMNIPAGTHSYMHRTVSLDYGIVLSGRLDLELDDGATVPLGAGDIVVQRGTVHAWLNPYEEDCRVVFVILPAEPVMVQGEALAPTHR